MFSYHQFIGVMIVAMIFPTFAQTADPIPTLPAPQNFHLYLMQGQSNMSGRGAVETEDKTPHPRVLMLTTNGEWRLAIEPVTHDRPKIIGVGPGLAFGKALAAVAPDVTIGLIPCSVGGSPLERWQRGGDLYSNAVHRARLAMAVGTLKGVIWHQGESDCTPDLAPSYGRRLTQMIRDFRAELGVPKLPFVVGQLGEFLATRQTNPVPEARLVNTALAALPEQLELTACVSSAGLAHKGDELHFDSASQRELGRRFARAMLELESR